MCNETSDELSPESNEMLEERLKGNRMVDPPNVTEIVVTYEQLLNRANELAKRVMGVDAETALRRLQSGQAENLRGTLFDSKLSQMMALLHAYNSQAV